MAIISYDPWLQKENARYGYFSDSELDTVIARVQESFNDWRKTSPAEKSVLLNHLGKLLQVESREQAVTITSEMGKVIKQSVAEVEKCASLCFWYASGIGSLSTSEERHSSSGISRIYFEPQGIILGVMPWNFPYWQALRFIIPVISGGNAVILRHASSVPLCALKIEKLFRDAGFPENLCRTVFAEYTQVSRIMARPEIRGLSLTGSSVAGRELAAIAGKNLKKSVLELGGSDPFIILNDADPESAANAAVYSRFQNCGQSCIAAKRLFVQSDAYHRFMSVFTDKVRNLKVGDPYDPDTFIGPMINEEALETLHDQLARSVALGARVITGGDRYYKDKPVYKPTILGDCGKDSPVIKEEVFGPVLPVTIFKNDAEAILMANDQEFGLGAAVWTADTGHALEIASQLDTGTVAINGFVRSDPALPFGGVKDSGYGRELSIEGFREFLNTKTVTVFT